MRRLILQKDDDKELKRYDIQKVILSIITLLFTAVCFIVKVKIDKQIFNSNLEVNNWMNLFDFYLGLSIYPIFILLYFISHSIWSLKLLKNKNIPQIINFDKVVLHSRQLGKFIIYMSLTSLLLWLILLMDLFIGGIA